MSKLGAALGWKHDHKPGIRTKGDKITGWPTGIGAKPTKAQQADIISEYEAEATEEDAKGAVDGQKILKAIIRWVAPLVNKTPAEARREIMDLYKSL